MPPHAAPCNSCDFLDHSYCYVDCILMSDKERPRADDGGGGGGNGGADEEDGEGSTENGDPRGRKCTGCGNEGKKVSLFRLRKGKKLLHQKRKEKGISVNSWCWGRRVADGGGGGWRWCCLCKKQPRPVDSSGESPTSDPNSSEFSFDMLRALIEKNDFFSKECNPHLDTVG